jgi:predicted  nucleic acid-binding Zn-ribbon protein
MKKKIKEVVFWIVSGLAALLGILLLNREENKIKDNNEILKEEIEKLDKEIEEDQKKLKLNQEELKEERKKTDNIVDNFKKEEGVDNSEEIDSDTADNIINDFINQ